MKLISQTIKNLIAGISQQPAILRYPEQLEAQENLFSTESHGLQRRPPTVHVASLNAAYLNVGISPLVSLIERDALEKYMVMFTGTGIRVWDLAGVEKSVNYEAGTVPYITTTNPRGVLKTVTVADYTFIINNTVEAAMASDIVTDTWATQGALINVKSGQYGRTYSIILNGTTVATYTTPDGSTASDSTKIDTNYIATQLASALITGWTVSSRGEGWLYILPSTGTITSVVTKDGYNNQAMFGFLKTTQKFTNLPATGPNGFVVKVSGESGSGADDYYIKYDTADAVWKECAKPGILSSFNPATMPHVLIRESDGSFTFQTADWDLREIGDDDSNPQPSFIGQKFRDIFFFRNRLGLIAGENCVLSKSGEFFKFWMTSAVDILDTDTVDQAVSSEAVALLYHVVPFNEEVVLFSEKQQFLGHADGTLTPKNFLLNRSTAFECDTSVKPIGAGRNVYFLKKRQEYSSLMEYYVVQDVTAVKNAQDVSAHVPSYIPNGTHKIISSTGENILGVLTTGQANAVFLYKYLFQNENRAQASWSRWSFNDAEILGADFVGSSLYLMVRRGAGLFMEKLLFTYRTEDLSIEPYRAFLDRKVIVTGGAYDDIEDETTLNVQAAYGNIPLQTGYTYGVLLQDGRYYTFPAAEMTSGVCMIPGNISGQQVIVGQDFDWSLTFTETMIKSDDGRGGVKADTEGRLQLRSFWVDYSDSGPFTATVVHQGKGTYTYEMTARLLGSNNNVLGSMPVETGQFKFPVASVSSGCTISLGGNGPTPFCIIGAGWEGGYYKRSQRI